jgi:hypothetical protein
MDRVTTLDRSIRLMRELVALQPEQLVEALQGSRVRLVARGCRAGLTEVQSALVTALHVLVRSGVTVEVDVAAVPAEVATLPGGPLDEALEWLGDAILPGSIAGPGRTDGEVVLALSPVPGHVQAIHLGVSGMTGYYGSAPADWECDEPLAAIAAGLLGATEALRRILGRMPLTDEARATHGLRRVVAASHRVEIPLPRQGIDVGVIDVVSAGAVTDAMVWTMVMRGSITGRGRVFDAGSFDTTNLNRYPTLLHATAEEGGRKARHLAAVAAPVLDLVAQGSHFAERDIRDAARRIVVGADDVSVRHLAQRARPVWLGIGATGHREVRVTEHASGPCAGCSHPHLPPAPPTVIPTIAPVSMWAGYVLACRLLRSAVVASNEALPDAYATWYPLDRPGHVEAGPTRFSIDCPLDPAHALLAA